MTPTLENIKDMVKGDNKVHFVRYHDGNLWYRVTWTPPLLRVNWTFEFPVPISDIGTATFLASDKAMLFMRYIRNHILALEAAKSSQDA